MNSNKTSLFLSDSTSDNRLISDIIKSLRIISPGRVINLFVSSFSLLPSIPRYRLTIVDSPTSNTTQCAVLFVPPDLESDLNFKTDEGKLRFIETQPFARLILVFLSREHTYGNISSQDELSPFVPSLTNSSHNGPIPFTMMEGDKDTRLVHSATSMNGEVIRVEDSEGRRSLIFANSPLLIQSQYLISINEKSNIHFDFLNLSFSYHYAMAEGALLNNHNGNIAIIGLGADPAIVDIAIKYFGFSTRIPIKIENGIDYISKMENISILIVDVNNDDMDILRCPSRAFISEETLLRIFNSISEDGIFIFNLSSRSEFERKSVIQKVMNIFPLVAESKFNDEVNRVVYAFKKERIIPNKSIVLLPIEEKKDRKEKERERRKMKKLKSKVLKKMNK